MTPDWGVVVLGVCVRPPVSLRVLINRILVPHHVFIPPPRLKTVRPQGRAVSAQQCSVRVAKVTPVCGDTCWTRAATWKPELAKEGNTCGRRA